MSLGSVWDDVIDIARDVWHSITHFFDQTFAYIKDGLVYLKEGVSFVINKIEEGLEFVLTLADKVLRIALKTVLLVCKAINWVLKLVGIDLTKVSSTFIFIFLFHRII